MCAAKGVQSNASCAENLASSWCSFVAAVHFVAEVHFCSISKFLAAVQHAAEVHFVVQL
jgi:hypothetical protein